MNVFPIAPGESRYLWLLIPVTVILLAVLIGGVGLLATSVRGAHASRFEIAGDGLRSRRRKQAGLCRGSGRSL